MTSRTMALRMAKQYRNCPPAELWHDPQQRDQLAAHLRICPYCDPALLDSAWEKLALALAPQRSSFTPTHMESPLTGDLRPIRGEYARWRNALYYRPPLVLVIERLSIADAVRVAQIYPDTLLAAPGDLVVSGRRAGGLPDFMIETWNEYTLRASQLGPKLATLSRTTLTAAKQLRQNPGLPPSWAPLPRPMTDENDPRRYFRELEVEVGYTFAAPAVAAMVEDLAGLSPPHLAFRTIGAAVAGIKQALPGVHWRRAPQSIQEALACVRLPAADIFIPSGKRTASRNEKAALFIDLDEHEPQHGEIRLAADDAPRPRFMGKSISLFQGRVQCVESLEFEIYQCEQLGGKLVMGGRLLQVPHSITGCCLVAVLVKNDSDPIPCEDHPAWDRDCGSFLLRFAAQGGKPAELELALLCETKKDALNAC